MPATTRPSDSRSSATSALASSRGWRSAGTATLVTSSRSPLDSTTAVSAVSPSSQGPAKRTWSFAPSDPNPASRAARAAWSGAEREPAPVEVQLRQVQPQVHVGIVDPCGYRHEAMRRLLLALVLAVAGLTALAPPAHAGTLVPIGAADDLRHAGVRRHPDRRPRPVGAARRRAYAYQWLRDGQPIAQATAATYRPGLDDLGPHAGGDGGAPPTGSATPGSRPRPPTGAGAEGDAQGQGRPGDQGCRAVHAHPRRAPGPLQRDAVEGHLPVAARQAADRRRHGQELRHPGPTTSASGCGCS